MTKFTVEGVTYDSKEFSSHQNSLLQSIEVTKGLAKEVDNKLSIFAEQQKIVAKQLKDNFGSKVKDVVEGDSKFKVILSNGKRFSSSEISPEVTKLLHYLLFVNSCVLELHNQSQVIDTARITYSKEFYITLNREAD